MYIASGWTLNSTNSPLAIKRRFKVTTLLSDSSCFSHNMHTCKNREFCSSKMSESSTKELWEVAGGRKKHNRVVINGVAVNGDILPLRLILCTVQRE